MKTEKEKMLSGELYNSADAGLRAESMRAKDLIHEYNLLKPSQREESHKILNELLGSMGENCFIHQPFFCDYGSNITIGDNFYANMNCVILDVGKITIGNNVMLAPNVNIYGATHPLDAKTRNSYLEYGFAVTIGNNVWIGGNSVILPGITIGDNSVIGAGSVVTKNIPANVVAAGNPCKIIRKIEQ